MPGKRRIPLPVVDLVTRYVDMQWSVERIAAVAGVSAPTVTQRLREAGVTIRARNDTKRGAPSPFRHQIDELAAATIYLSEPNAGVREIARRLGCHRDAVRRALVAYNVPLKSLSALCHGKRNGPANPNWRDDLTDDERATRRDMAKQAQWRAQVYARDGFKCVRCGDDTGGNLNAHHVESHDTRPELRWDVNNGATLCADCHRTFHKAFGYGNNNAVQFAAFVNP